MHTLRMHEKSGADGILHLDVPVGVADTDYEVVVVVQPQAADQRGWLPGFFEPLARGWQGEPLERPPQGEYERREPLQ